MVVLSLDVVKIFRTSEFVTEAASSLSSSWKKTIENIFCVTRHIIEAIFPALGQALDYR